MAASKPLYDLVLMLDTAAEESRRVEILAGAKEAVNNSGEVVNEQDWGARAMAFEIRHKKDAEYHLLQFHGPPELLSQLERTLRITDEVIRFRIIKLAPGTPPPPDTRPEPRAGTAPESVQYGDDAPEDVDDASAGDLAVEPAPAGDPA